MIDVGLIHVGIAGLGKAEVGKTRIASLLGERGRDRVAAEPIEVERAALEAVRDLLVVFEHFDEEIAVAGAVERRGFLRDGFARIWVERLLMEFEELRLASIGHRKLRDEFGDRLGVEHAGRKIVRHRRHRVAGHQRVAPEGFAREEHAAREPERGIELALERGLEPRDVDAKVPQQGLGGIAVERFRRLQRFAAAVAEDQPVADAELVALGVTAKVVVIIEDEDARVGAGGTAIVIRCRKPADPATHDHEVVAFLDRQAFDRDRLVGEGHFMHGLERARVVPA